MQKLEYEVRFTTPAFLGDAEQNGRWRTPPFKALLRQWWRVVYAADQGFDVRLDDMRREEALLFGHAWLEDDSAAARRSLVRLRLERWDEGSLKKQQWPSDTNVPHPEVKGRQGKPRPVGSALYLGYGPLEFSNGTALKKNAAIQAGESATLALAVPDEEATRIERALWLMDRYGSVGGRSRNGWGSFVLRPLPRGEGSAIAGNPPLRPWQDALNLDWPHALGRDDKGALIWRTADCDDWKAVMKRLAEIKIGLRTKKPEFEFRVNPDAGDQEKIDKKTGKWKGVDHGAPQNRHWLSYPVTNHSVRPWGNNARLPNTLRFKVRPSADGKFFGVVFHVPHKPPADFHPNTATLERVWQQVHAYLGQNLTRIPE